MYLITREELIAWFVEGNNCIDDFFVNKKPVEEIAGGKVEWIVKNFKAWWQIGDTPLFKIGNKFKDINKYDGKSIKIYVEVKDV